MVMDGDILLKEHLLYAQGTRSTMAAFGQHQGSHGPVRGRAPKVQALACLGAWKQSSYLLAGRLQWMAWMDTS